MATYHITCADCSHCVDLHGAKDDDQVDLTKGREAIENQIIEWLLLDAEERGMRADYAFL